jgi:aspartate aminotransferase
MSARDSAAPPPGLRLARRLGRIKPSLTLAVTAKAAALARKGVDIASYGAGEPDFDTPAHIREAAKRALDGGATRYTDVGGTPELRDAVAKWLDAAHGGLGLAAENILVSCGAKHSLYNLFQALLDEGDEVVVSAPYWVSYPEMIGMAGGTPVILETRPEEGFLFSGAQLDAVCTPRTRAVILVSPSNPTGAVADRANLESIAEVCVRRNLLVVSDDIYRSLVYGDAAYTQIATLGREIRERTILVDGVSKTYAMTGWRIGFCAAPAPLIRGMATMQGQSTSNPAAVSQAAALAAITGPQDCVEAMRQQFDRRRRAMVDRLRAMPGVQCVEPRGAFYAFPDLRGCLGKRAPGGARIADDLGLAEYLLEHARVAVVPGSGFGAPGFARLSYATSLENIEAGLSRMHAALVELT